MAMVQWEILKATNPWPPGQAGDLDLWSVASAQPDIIEKWIDIYIWKDAHGTTMYTNWDLMACGIEQRWKHHLDPISD